MKSKFFLICWSLTCIVACSKNESLKLGELSSPKDAEFMASFFPEDLTLNFLNQEGTQSSILTGENLSLTDNDMMAIKSGGNYSFRGMLGETSECLGRAKNWRVTAIRFAPNQVPYPGQPGVWKKWAQAQGKRLDLVPEIRYVLRPFCQVIDPKTDTLATKSMDHALHVIFRPSPDIGIDRNIILGKEFSEHSLRGDFAFTDKLTSENIELLSTPSWINYRRSVINDWNAISKVRAVVGRNTNSLSKLYSALFNFANGFMLGSAVSNDLQSKGESPLEIEVSKITTKYAKRGNIAAITSMSSDISRRWIFGSFRFDTKLQLIPQKMLTFRANLEGTRVRLFAIAEQAQGVQPSRSIGSVAMVPGVDPIVFQQQEGGPEDILSDGPGSFPKFKQFITNLEQTSPTTMTCESCHKLAAEFDKNGEIPAVQERFIMTEAGKISILTAVETTEDAKKLNTEFSLKP